MTGYPPDPHVLRDLDFTTERAGERVLLRTTTTGYMLDGTGHVMAGVLAVLVDVGAAARAIDAVRPDWTATADLSVHGTPVNPGPLLVDVAPLRVGSKIVVLGAEIHRGVDDPDPTTLVGHGLVTFARIPGSATEVRVDGTSSGEPVPFSPSRPLDRDLTTRCGIEVTDAATGRVEMPHGDYTRNSFGTVNGGVMALLCDVAGRELGATVLEAEVTSVGLEVHYLSQARQGPVATTASVVRVGSESATLRVEAHDLGEAGELMAVAIVDVVTV